MQLEGTVRQIGIHACGVIIGADDLTNFAPLAVVEDKVSKQNILVTQYEGSVVEDVGLIKMDFLGLSTLTIIKEALANIKKSRGIEVDINDIPLDDPETYELFCKGDTVATFQFESPGMQKYLKELKPSKFEDLIAMNALYRPGPMDNIPQFIRRKHGQEEIKYDIPIMEKYLKDTYGITVYQEQVMLLSRQLANFTRGESDTLRKAMGKKQRDKLDQMKPKFLKQGQSNGHDPAILEKIWGEWEKFASYAFNKSHATCYSWVAYQTAYLKAHYRAEFMAANLTNKINNLTEISICIEDAQKSNIQVLGPDINESNLTFAVNKDGNIRFGLAGLKGLGGNATACIVAERDAHGPYKDIFDFITRIDLRSCNKRAIESLAMAGAFDGFSGMHRAQFFVEKNGQTFVDRLINYAVKLQTKDNFQTSIFDMSDSVKEETTLPLPNCEPWGEYEQLKHEKEIAGFYISGHPLDEFKPIIQNYTSVTLEQLNDDEYMCQHHISGKPFAFVGIVVDHVAKVTRTNREFGTITLEDFNGTWEWTLFGEEYTRFKHFFEPGKRLLIQARLLMKKWRDKKTGDETMRMDIKPDTIHYLEEVYEKMCQEVMLVLSIHDITPSLAEDIQNQLNMHKGLIPFSIRILEQGNVFFSDFQNTQIKVNPESFVKSLKLPVNYHIELK